eukprot:PhM_4_TR8898/c0_g1_i1/m.88105/K00213/DHCR7; 7-dehydrocholesterol reductase
MWASKERSASVGLVPGRQTLGPLFLVFACPLTVLGLLEVNGVYNGDLCRALSDLFTYGPNPSGFYGKIKDELLEQVVTVAVFAIFELFLMAFLPPQRKVRGPKTPAGLHAQYVDNGFQAYIVTIIAFVGLSDLGPVGLFPIDVWFDNMPALAVVLNAFATLLCIWLLLRTYVLPRSKDYGSTGNLIFDYYCGRELHPRLWFFDIKQFTNCRFGMMLWPVLVVSAVGAEYKRFGTVSNAGLVTAGLQMAYLTKFFHWEKGYFSTIDMMHDRAGYYLCWGCICWVPSLYANASIFMANAPHTSDMTNAEAIACAVFGIIMLFFNYDCDLQRGRFRTAMSAGKEFRILGRPAKYMTATYKTEDGKVHTSSLLLSGYWGMSRHLNYLTELLFTLAFCLPSAFVGTTGCTGGLVGFFYLIFLTALLVDRSYRDDARCKSKYGDTWAKYCEQVPYKIVPYIF